MFLSVRKCVFYSSMSTVKFVALENVQIYFDGKIIFGEASVEHRREMPKQTGGGIGNG